MKDNSYMDELVNFGNMLADKSDEIIMQYFRHPFDIQTKEDNSINFFQFPLFLLDFW